MGFRSESEAEAPSPNDFHFSSLRAASGGERTPSMTAKKAFGKGNRKDWAGSGAEKQNIGRE
jgi:hypothetical protein